MEERANFNEVLKKEEEIKEKFDYIRFTVSDINGVGRTIVVPRRHAEEAFKDGVFFYQGIMAADPRAHFTFAEESTSNCNFVPCPNTFHEIPWSCRDVLSKDKARYKTGQVLCEINWTPSLRNASRMEGCSRYVLRRQLEELKKIGLTFKSAFEVEFTVYQQETNKPFYDGKDCCSTLRMSQCEEFLYTLESNFQKAGIDTNSFVIEYSPGQFEFRMEPVDGIKGADTMFLIKQAIKEISNKLGYTATLMTKPFKTSYTNGLHLNMSLWRKGAESKMINAFYDSLDPEHLSAIHRHWIAGLIKHGKALCAFCCPTSNCYRRLHDFMTPSKIEWGLDNRLAAYRAKSMSPYGTYVECRLPSGACNPYLATACVIAAGMDGILNKLPLPAQRTEKFDKNAHHAPKTFKPDTESDKYFPFTLKDAIDELEKDDVIKEAMGEEIVEWFVKVKRELDIAVIEPLDEELKWEKESYLFFEFL